MAEREIIKRFELYWVNYSETSTVKVLFSVYGESETQLKTWFLFWNLDMRLPDNQSVLRYGSWNFEIFAFKVVGRIGGWSWLWNLKGLIWILFFQSLNLSRLKNRGMVKLAKSRLIYDHGLPNLSWSKILLIRDKTWFLMCWFFLGLKVRHFDF